MNELIPLFIATRKFDASAGAAWVDYVRWAKIPGLIEVVSLDGLLCPPVIANPGDEDWRYISPALGGIIFFSDVEYLIRRTADTLRKNVLGLYKNPVSHIAAAPCSRACEFLGYDLIEDETLISALTDCGGFPETFSNEELNPYGLISSFDRAAQVHQLLPRNHPDEPHARCELYALWRLKDISF
jgi:hypothetical protein